MLHVLDSKWISSCCGCVRTSRRSNMFSFCCFFLLLMFVVYHLFSPRHHLLIITLFANYLQCVAGPTRKKPAQNTSIRMCGNSDKSNSSLPHIWLELDKNEIFLRLLHRVLNAYFCSFNNFVAGFYARACRFSFFPPFSPFTPAAWKPCTTTLQMKSKLTTCVIILRKVVGLFSLWNRCIEQQTKNDRKNRPGRIETSQRDARHHTPEQIKTESDKAKM